MAWNKDQREIKVTQEGSTWVITVTNDDGEGAEFKCIMSGPFAKSRAERHAERIQRNTD